MSSWYKAIDCVDDLLNDCKNHHKYGKCHNHYKYNKSYCHDDYKKELHVDKLCVGEMVMSKCDKYNKPCAPVLEPKSCATFGHVIYYDAFTSQTIASGSNIKFNITGPKSSNIVHSDSINNDVITVGPRGVYKVEYTLTLDPQADTSAPPDDHVFAIVANNIVNVPSKFGNGQHNSIATYQINGSTLLVLDTDNTNISLRNVGATVVTLAKSLDTTTVVGASLILTKL
jgi:hypothetical protein